MMCTAHGSLPFDAPTPDDGALAAALGAQVDAGLDVVGDGQPGWRDSITPLLAPLGGVRLGPPCSLPLGIALAARPVVEAKLRRHHSVPAAAYTRAAALSRAPVMAALTGPYTLAAAAEIATTAYRRRADLAADLSTLLAQDVTALIAAGARYVEIDEPLLLAQPDDAKLVRTLLEPLVDAAEGLATVLVATHGADAGACYAQLNSLAGDVIAVDCTARRPELLAAIAETGAGKPLALGVVDGSATVEDAAGLARLIERLLGRYVHDVVWLQPAAGLGHLPPAVAYAKLRALVDARSLLAGGAGAAGAAPSG